MLVLVALEARAAGPDRPPQEVVVYGDDFARWDHTRWLLESELLLPLGFTFTSTANASFTTCGFQVRAVLACEKDARLSKHRFEVSCAIEDLGLRVTTPDRWRTERDRRLVQAVLDEVDERLTGARVQLQVDDQGGLTDVDLEGVTADDLRERQSQETLRQLAARMMAGFHLRIPEHAAETGTWAEAHSELMDLPSLTASRGSSLLVHAVSPLRDDLRLVQSRGEGVTIVSLPLDVADPFAPPPAKVEGEYGFTSGGGIGPASLPDPLTITPGGPGDRVMAQGESGQEAKYAMSVTGVAVFQRSTGIMTERVWTAEGVPTACSSGSVGRYRDVGRIRILDATEHPDVGASVQVAWPGRPMDGLDAWTPLEVTPADLATRAEPTPPG